jgi:hypothetical protein
MALEKLTEVRLRFGDPHHIALLGVLRLRARALELIKQIGADECVRCEGRGWLPCEICDSTGSCPHCGGDCGACAGAGLLDCSVCGGSGRAVVSMDADPSEIEELIEKLERKTR